MMSLPPATSFALAVLIVFAAKTLAWLIQRRSGNAGIVDAIWSFTLGALALHFALFGSAPDALRVCLALMGGLWGLRLGLHLWRRNAGRAEDWRYAQLRARWGAQAQLKMFAFFQFQNLFTLALAASAFLPIAYRNTMPPAWAIALALGIWLVSVAGEALADLQMERFRANPAHRGRVCTEGLWGWSRHPNYFFECLHWCAYVPLALGGAFGWASLAAPLVMALLLMKLSGVPLMEAEMMRRKPGYADYVERTSPLIPWPPRRPRKG